ncbi:MAG: formate/nitrite transporter family protein [Candidatus Berkelbacteria bacterium]
MSDNFHSTPVPDLYAHAEGHATKKTGHPLLTLILLSVLGGIFIAFGGAFATLIGAGTSTIPVGIVKTLMGIAFSLGLILVLVGGAELFTGSTIIVIGWLQKKVSCLAFLKNLVIVYLGNFVGSLFIAGLIFLGREYSMNNGTFGIAAFSIANAKMSHGFSEAIVLGILANMLVCLGIWLNYSARNTTDKIMAILFPVTAFVAMGFEHSIANMYLIPIALFIKKFDPEFVITKHITDSSLTWSNFFVHNLIPVTIGNVIGGILIWWFVWMIYGRKKEDKS